MKRFQTWFHLRFPQMCPDCRTVYIVRDRSKQPYQHKRRSYSSMPTSRLPSLWAMIENHRDGSHVIKIKQDLRSKWNRKSPSFRELWLRQQRRTIAQSEQTTRTRGQSLKEEGRSTFFWKRNRNLEQKICKDLRKIKVCIFTHQVPQVRPPWVVGWQRQAGGWDWVMVMVKMSWWDWCLWVWRPSSWWWWLWWRAINFAIMVLTDPKSFRPPPSTVPGSALSPLPIRWVVFVSTLPLLDFSCSRLGLESFIPWYFFLGREKN